MLFMVIVLKCIEILSHCVVYRNQHSLVGQLHFNSKQIHRKRDEICCYWRRDEGGERNWMKVVERYRHTCKRYLGMSCTT